MKHDCTDESWNMVGKVGTFLSAEKSYKDAYRKLLRDVPSFIPNPKAETQISEGIQDIPKGAEFDGTNVETFSRWLIQPIEHGDDYELFVSQANELLTIIRNIIPQNTKMVFILKIMDKLGQIKPKRNVLSCVSFYTVTSNLCELVHLHRTPDRYQTGWMLVKKADKHLGLGVLHYVAIANKLIRLANTDWTLKTMQEVLKLIGNNFQRFQPISNNIALEDALPLAELAYKSANNIYNPIYLQHINVTLSNGYQLQHNQNNGNGRFHLPLSMNGFVAVCGHEIIVGFRGTGNLINWFSDFIQYIVGTSLIYKMALGLMMEIYAQYGNNLLVVGHSLGGGLTQFSVAGLNAPGVKGVGFNSAGLSDMSYSMLKGCTVGSISHVYLRYDQIFHIGIQIGERYVQCGTETNPYKAHVLSTMRRHLCQSQPFFSLI